MSRLTRWASCIRSVSSGERNEVDELVQDTFVRAFGSLDGFRGESRFTTWAYRFVILEVSSKIARHFWRQPTVSMEPEDWDRLPDRFGMRPAATS